MTFAKVNNPGTKNFDGLMKNFFNEIPAAFRDEVLVFPPVNIIEKNTAYYLEVASPGMEKTDFILKLDGTLLTISATKKEEFKDETSKPIRKEFGYKEFKRSFTLNEKIDASNISAKYESGILKVVLPKKVETKVASKEITIQ